MFTVYTSENKILEEEIIFHLRFNLTLKCDEFMYKCNVY